MSRTERTLPTEISCTLDLDCSLDHSLDESMDRNELAELFLITNGRLVSFRRLSVSEILSKLLIMSLTLPELPLWFNFLGIRMGTGVGTC